MKGAGSVGTHARRVGLSASGASWSERVSWSAWRRLCMATSEAEESDRAMRLSSQMRSCVRGRGAGEGGAAVNERGEGRRGGEAVNERAGVLVSRCE